jgi:hypothetical protein
MYWGGIEASNRIKKAQKIAELINTISQTIKKTVLVSAVFLKIVIMYLISGLDY